MKKCPFCQAVIEDNARFCLYCMASLEEKQQAALPKRRRWLILVLAAVIAVGALTAVLLWPEKPAPIASTKMAAPDTVTEGAPTTEATEAKTAVPAVDVTIPDVPQGSHGNGIPGTEGYRTEWSVQNWQSAWDDGVLFVDGAVDYYYEQAAAEDIADPRFVLTEEDIVITGLSAGHRNGIYEVDSEGFNGLNVIAVRYISDDVVKLTLGESVQFIGSGAFGFCNELAYVCVKGDRMTIAEDAFAPTEDRWYPIVIRCSAACKDMYGRYWKDIAKDYGLVWEEWNG